MVQTYPERVGTLAIAIELYDKPDRELASRLDELGHFLSDMRAVLYSVRSLSSEDTSRGFELTEQLDQLSYMTQRARDTVEDFKATLEHELRQRAAERDQYRSNQRFAHDQQTLRKLAMKAAVLLQDLRTTIDHLPESFHAAGPDAAGQADTA